MNAIIIIFCFIAIGFSLYTAYKAIVVDMVPIHAHGQIVLMASLVIVTGSGLILAGIVSGNSWSHYVESPVPAGHESAYLFIGISILVALWVFVYMPLRGLLAKTRIRRCLSNGDLIEQEGEYRIKPHVLEMIRRHIRREIDIIERWEKDDGVF